MQKIIIAAAALALFVAPALAENAKSGARTLNPFIGFSQGYNQAFIEPASGNRSAYAAGVQGLNVGDPYKSPRQGRADKR
jgi:hypothetical protein